jgi:hypothetical protein
MRVREGRQNNKKLKNLGPENNELSGFELSTALKTLTRSFYDIIKINGIYNI